jgi:hypothetical protein
VRAVRSFRGDAGPIQGWLSATLEKSDAAFVVLKGQMQKQFYHRIL